MTESTTHNSVILEKINIREEYDRFFPKIEKFSQKKISDTLPENLWITPKGGNTLLDRVRIKLQKILTNLETCQKNHIIINCGQCGNHQPIPISCYIRICPKCEKARSFRVLKKIKPYISLMENTKLFTLTYAEHQSPSKEIKRKLELFCREFRRRIGEKGYNLSGFRALELEPKGDQFYYHFHYAIVGNYFLPIQKISKIWQEVTGSSYISDIRKCGRKTAIDYLLKYITKPIMFEKIKKLSDWEKLKLYVEIFYRSRMLTRIGSFYDIDPVYEYRRYRCCSCGSEDWIVIFHWEEPITGKVYSSKKIDWGGLSD